MATIKTYIDSEKELYDAANELRTVISENIYKNYKLLLDFLNYLNECIEIVYKELKRLIIDSDCYITDKEEIQKQDYKLTPDIYVGTEAEEEGIPFGEKMEEFKATLLEQSEKVMS